MLRFLAEFRRFSAAAQTSKRMRVAWSDRHVCLEDRESTSGFDRHYFYHLGWAARVLAETQPEVHTDISSNLRFCSVVSAFVPVEFYEYHPPAVELARLGVHSVDLLKLPFADGSVSSLSCMHVVEHVGLGRYGDPLDPDADLQAMAELKRALAPGGQLLFVVPVGRPRVAFNAHRVYALDTIEEAFTGLDLREFALIPDSARDGGLIRGAAPELAARQDCGCGCFWFVRPEKQQGG